MSVGESLAYDETFKDPQKVDVAAASTRSTILAPGRYAMISTVDCRVKRGGNDVVAAVASGTRSFLLKANTYFFFSVYNSEKAADTGANGSNAYVAVIVPATGGATGELEIAQVNR